MRWSTQRAKNRIGITLYEATLFSMFGAVIFGSKILMEFLPNIHLVGMFTVLLTVVYRTKALIPVYIFVFLNGVYGGFNIWWVTYLYVWTVLWGMTMLIPRDISPRVAVILYPVVCSLHGFLFGILYAPAQALFFNLNFEQTVTWVLAGSLFDTVHGVSNLIAGLLIFPLSVVLKKLNKSVYTRIE